MDKKANELMIYEDKNDITKLNVKFMDNKIQINENSTCKKFLQVKNEGNMKVKRKISNNGKNRIIYTQNDRLLV